jgi:hypothetical protein
MTSPKPPGTPSGPKSPIYRAVGLALLFAILATIVFVFVRTLVFDQPINDQALKQALVAASVGITLSCLIAWVLDLLQIIDLQPGWSKLLWSVLIASILGSSALVYRQFSSATNVLTITCARPVTMDASSGRWIHPITAMNTEVHKRGAFFGFLVGVRSLQIDATGSYNLNLRYEFVDRSGKTSFSDTPYSGNAQKMGSDAEHRKRMAEYTQAMPDCMDKNMVALLVRTNLAPIDPREGIYQLDVIVYDNVGRSFARKEIPMTIQGTDAK